MNGAPPGYPSLGSELTSATGKYRVDSLLGEGGMGAVFGAFDLHRGTPVAIKLTSPELRLRPGIAARFANEAEATARVASEHIVKIFGVEATADGTPFIVMELLRGHDLDAVIDQSAPMEVARAVHFALQILRALQVAHFAGIIHRDLKPTNAFVLSPETTPPGESEFVKLIDFGITKILGDEARGLTRTSTTLGTPAYMSPEQAKNAKNADGRSDLYAVGVILYELLTRRRPFDGESANELIVKICTEPPIPILTARPDLHPMLAAAVERALVKNPSARHPRADAFADALRPFADARSAPVLSRIDAGAGGGMPALASYAAGASSVATPMPSHVVIGAGTERMQPLAYDPRVELATTPFADALPIQPARAPQRDAANAPVASVALVESRVPPKPLTMGGAEVLTPSSIAANPAPVSASSAREPVSSRASVPGRSPMRTAATLVVALIVVAVLLAGGAYFFAPFTTAGATRTPSPVASDSTADDDGAAMSKLHPPHGDPGRERPGADLPTTPTHTGPHFGPHPAPSPHASGSASAHPSTSASGSTSPPTSPSPSTSHSTIASGSVAPTPSAPPPPSATGGPLPSTSVRPPHIYPMPPGVPPHPLLPHASPIGTSP